MGQCLRYFPLFTKLQNTYNLLFGACFQGVLAGSMIRASCIPELYRLLTTTKPLTKNYTRKYVCWSHFAIPKSQLYWPNLSRNLSLKGLHFSLGHVCAIPMKKVIWLISLYHVTSIGNNRLRRRGAAHCCRVKYPNILHFREKADLVF